jgi:hypothetical protein
MHLTYALETLRIRAVLRSRESPVHVRRTGLFAWAHAKSNKADQTSLWPATDEPRVLGFTMERDIEVAYGTSALWR